MWCWCISSHVQGNMAQTAGWGHLGEKTLCQWQSCCCTYHLHWLACMHAACSPIYHILEGVGHFLCCSPVDNTVCSFLMLGCLLMTLLAGCLSVMFVLLLWCCSGSTGHECHGCKLDLIGYQVNQHSSEAVA